MFLRGDALTEFQEFQGHHTKLGAATLVSHGETGADNFTCYEYNGGSDLTVLHDEACPPKLPERRRDDGTYFAYDANGNTAMEQAPLYARYFDWDGRDMLQRLQNPWQDLLPQQERLLEQLTTGPRTYTLEKRRGHRDNRRWPEKRDAVWQRKSRFLVSGRRRSYEHRRRLLYRAGAVGC